MLKTVNNKYIKGAAGLMALLAMMVVASPVRGQGAGWFTLTNSPLYFFDGNEQDTLADGTDDPAYQYRTGFDMLNNPTEGVAINDLGTHHYHSTYHTTAKGEYYLMLDTSNTDANGNPAILATSAFSPLCVWYRTGYTGYYYQTWTGPGGVEYEYYLTASSSEGLYIVKHRKGAPLSKQTTWYNWDFGAAITEEQWHNGQKETHYYWLVAEDRTAAGAEQLPPVWKLSEVPSYQRPDAEKYTNFRMVNPADESQGNTWDGQKKYFWNVDMGAGENYPRGSAALYLPVEVIDHGRDNPEFQRNTGLTGIDVSESSISFGSTVDVSATVSLNYGTIALQHAPRYVEYIEETYRRGINLNYRNRSQQMFRSAGVAKSETAYFYRNAMHVNPPDPSSASASYVVDSVVFSIDAVGSRYLRIVPDTWTETYVPYGGSTYEDLYQLGSCDGDYTSYINYGFEVRCIDGMAYLVDEGLNNANMYNQSIYCYDVPSSAVSSKIYATVYMSSDMDPDGLQRVQTLEIPITISPQKYVTEIHSTAGPAIRGSVFGGGRMANVTGNTNVTVHNADTIYAVYGGNDIAGWVQGSEGATLQIGTSQTREEHPVHIGYVYGGGCGYYSYSGVYDAAHPDAARTFTSQLGFGQYCFNGNVYKWGTTTAIADSLVVSPEDYDFEYTPYQGADFAERENGTQGLQDGKIGGTLPYIKTAHITIGEAEQMDKGLHYDNKGHDAHEHNDYILIDSVFGGAENAFIGVTADGSHANAVTIDVNGGTIMALFGGNNYGGAVADAATVTIDVNCTKLIDEAEMKDNTVYSGYGRDFGIRNLYGGGNMVESPHSELFVYGGMIDTAFLGGNDASVKSPIGRIACERSNSNPPQLYTIGTTTIDGHFIYTNPTMDTTNGGRNQFDGFETDRGLYNIRMIFGGNNQAPMKNLAFISLYSGGVGSIYGGGNHGDMLNESDVSVTAQDYMDPSALTALTYDLHHAFDAAEGFITEPPKIGSIVASRENSHIIADYIYGGSRNSNVKHSCGVYLAGGNVSDVFGGNDVSGDVGSLHDGGSYVVVTKNAVVQGNVYGGSDGYYHFDDGTGHYDDTKMINTMYNVGVDYDPYNEFTGLLIPTGNHSNVFINGGLVKGNVVAGGNMADVGFDEKTYHINVDGTEHEFDLNGTYDAVDNPYGLGGAKRGTARLMLAGNAEVWGNVFGGGANASIWGLSQVWVKDSPVVLGSLFAGNDCVGTIHSWLPCQLVVDYYRFYYDSIFDKSVAIAATHEDSLAYMEAHMTAPQRERAELANQRDQAASNGEKLNRYEGGHYQPNYASYVRIEGTPIINSVYGSGNGAWNYPQYDDAGNATWDYEGARTQFENVYVSATMAGDRPNMESTFIDINTAGGFIDTVFGGGAGCSVNQSVTVLLNNKSLDNPAYPLDKINNYVKPMSERIGRRFVGSRSVDKKEVSYPNFVGTIFGGNNFDDMANCVPEIQLLKGNVKNVYGGGNAGDMKAYAMFEDACKNAVEGVSSHVLVESDDVTVTDSVFGGCRMSNISGMTFVDVRHTSKDGIQYLFGGNDISGNVGGNTRIDVSGGKINRIWGGSNGRYDFVAVGPDLYNVYPFGLYDARDPEYGLITVADRPTVDSTHINLWGGRIGASVFTGGSMADCDATCLIVDDMIETRTDDYGQKVCDATFDSAITILGAVYGGGEGRWDDLNARDFNGKRWGNVNGSTHVHLYHAQDVTSAKAYGGGGGGDVNNTYIRTYDTWNSPFDQMFGGCWGSDVNGTTHLVFDGKELVRELFGGNDFSGYVYATDVVINSGNFTDVFGGGNGEYPNSYYTTQHAGALDPQYGYAGAQPDAYSDIEVNGVTKHRHLEHPNTEYVHITVNATKDTNVNVWTNIYGGGKVGTVYPLQKDALGNYKYQEAEKLHRIPDTSRVLAAAAGVGDSVTFTDPQKFSYIVLNIHGGRYHQDVFGGGRGPSAEQIYEASQSAVAAATEAGLTEEQIRAAGNAAVEEMKHPIVYGLKVVNMDRGDVYHSLYGGSEYVHDGYPAECKIPYVNGVEAWNPQLSTQLAVTSMRPSSIVNITGGMVEHNLYGAGYMGNVFGSVYLNLGADAIDSCTVWRNSYAASDTGAYRIFKPGNDVTGVGGTTLSDALKINNIMMNESVFAGANWGEGAGSTQLTTRGFYGGESRLYIDGKNYNTSSNDQALEDGSMFIKRSVLGSGTSVEGGDVHSQVEIRNYGATDACGQPVRTLESIQRTDSLWLHNTAIWLTGATDASSVNLTNKYTMSRIGDACFRGYNVTEFDAPINEVGNMAFYEQSSDVDDRHSSEEFRTPYIEVPKLELDTQDELSEHACGQKQSICSKTFMVDPKTPDMRHTLLILNNGIEFTIGQNEYPTAQSTGQFKYGFVKGFAFATTPGGVNSLISARFKLKQASLVSTNADDGGFMSPCDTCNKTVEDAQGYGDINPDWAYTYTTTDEFPYTNYGSTSASGTPGAGSYRVWKVGDERAEREREATLLAHVNPSKLDQDKYVKLGTALGSQNLAVAEVTFDLPATVGGNYYTLRWQEDIEIDGSNMMMNLVDSAWSPSLGSQNNQNVNMTQRLKTIGDACNVWANDVSGQGSWKWPTNHDEPKGVRKIISDPENSFGLVMVPDNNFALNASNTDFDMPSVAASADEANLVISGNQRVNSNYIYTSPKVYNPLGANGQPTGEPVKPSMRLYLTYSPTFASTFTGTVTFYLNELKANGDTVGTVKVKVNIQTIIDELQDMEQDVLAMYNGGRTNEYTRKIIIPGLGEERRLYIEGIRWLPTEYDGTDTTAAATSSAFGQTDRFSLVGDTTSLTATNDPNYPHDLSMTDHNNNIHKSHNRFGLTLIPTNDVAEASRQFNGWGGTTYPINLYRLVYPTGNDAVKTVDWDDNEGTANDTVAYHDLTAGGTTKGYFVGTLDGRGSAGLDVKLNFDGSRTYDQLKGNSYVGRLQLHMKTYYERGGTNEQRDDFTVTIYVKTRAHGDTIYVASTDHLQRCIPLTVDPSTGAGSNPCCIDLYPYNSASNPHNAGGTPDYTPSDIGKKPSLYVQTLTKALDNDIYQEGDVIAILDTVQVTSVVNITGNKSLHVVGPLGPPIEVIRYDGHHHELPDEASVFRGAMIKVSNDGHFTSQNIAFHGGAGAVIKKVKRNASGQAVANDGTTLVNSCSNLAFKTESTPYSLGGQSLTYTVDKFPDTNRAFGPIIEVTNNGLASLKDGSLVHHNWNAYGALASQRNADSLTNKPELMGAISITRGGKLQLKSNVEISHNFTHTMWGDKESPVAVEYAPGNGNIYVDGGTLELTDTKRETAVTITDNYLMNPAIHTGTADDWWEVANHVIVGDNGTINVPERWSLKPSVIKNWKKANVYLTRTAPTTGTDTEKMMKDVVSSTILVSGTVGDSTKIGVRKWFPGEQIRDTIRIASVSGGNIMVLDNAVQNGAFKADDGFRVFYNSVVNTTQAYFFRCASFKHQMLAGSGYVDPVYEYSDNNTDAHTLQLAAGNVLKFGNKHNVCPDGGDSLIYRVQGGFMPYTFTWSDPAKTVTLSTKETPYRNTQVQYDLADNTLSNEARYAKYAASMSDTLLLPHETMTSANKQKWNHLLVSAVDATGECELHKYIDVRINMDRNIDDPVTYWPKASALADTSSHRDNSSPWRNDTVGTGWSDTSRTVHAVASRNFKGVQITPRVWVDRSKGTISATIDGENNDYVYQDEEDGTHELDNVLFCPGKVIHLNTKPRGSSTQFIMWDFDPYYRPLAPYVVPNHDDVVTAYYGPGNYWYQAVDDSVKARATTTTTYYYSRPDVGGNPADFVTTYNGDVHIYSENGLAWLISVVNGLNGQQIRPFRFNRIFLHKKDAAGTPYDMKDYLWTPVGTLQHSFRGHLIGVSENETSTTPLDGERVVVKNIILNEPNMNDVGFFSKLDTAHVISVELQSVLAHGAQNVGALAAQSHGSKFDNVSVNTDDEGLIPGTEDFYTTTILATHYISGGLIGLSLEDTVNNYTVAAKYVGDAVYSGGVVGHATSSQIINGGTRNDSRMSGLYVGGIAGYSDGRAPVSSNAISRLFNAKTTTGWPTHIANNYVHFVNNGQTARAGGLVGYAQNTVLENNYIYGEVNGLRSEGGVAATMGTNASADKNYYAKGSAKQDVATMTGNASVSNTATFSGSGNQVTTSVPVDGIDNLTRVLNHFVREANINGGNYKTWRNSLDGSNSGYPVFGQPDLIPVVGEITLNGCDTIEWEGHFYTHDTVLTSHVIDTVEMVDSISNLHFIIHHSTVTHLADSGIIGDRYTGHGFEINTTEAALAFLTTREHPNVTLVLYDTLTTALGCDSIICLTLTLIPDSSHNNVDVIVTPVRQTKILVYPNPTTSHVTVETYGLTHVELYDNEGRRLRDFSAPDGSESLNIDVSTHPAGIYYLRVHNSEGVSIQKLIKK